MLTIFVAWSGLADIILAILPWWIVARHAMNMKERIGLLVCMSLGVLWVARTSLNPGERVSNSS